jgi:hypothetical protein
MPNYQKEAEKAVTEAGRGGWVLAAADIDTSL